MAYVRGRRRANQVVVHLDNDELNKLNGFTKNYGYCREEFIRDAINHFGRFINEDVTECKMKNNEDREASASG